MSSDSSKVEVRSREQILKEKYPVAFYTTQTIAFTLGIGIFVNFLVLGIVGMKDEYIGDKCDCLRTNFQIQNITVNNETMFEIDYKLFCPETLEFAVVTYKSYEDYYDAVAVANYAAGQGGTTKCCFTGGVASTCHRTTLGMLGGHLIYIGALLSIFVVVVSFSIYYSIVEHMEKKIKQMPRFTLGELDIEMATQDSPLIE
jgi:hypothetical protein